MSPCISCFFCYAAPINITTGCSDAPRDSRQFNKITPLNEESYLVSLSASEFILFRFSQHSFSYGTNETIEKDV